MDEDDEDSPLTVEVDEEAEVELADEADPVEVPLGAAVLLVERVAEYAEQYWRMVVLTEEIPF